MQSYFLKNEKQYSQKRCKPPKIARHNKRQKKNIEKRERKAKNGKISNNKNFVKTQIWKNFVIIVYIATLFVLQFFHMAGYWKRSFRHQHPYDYTLVL